MKTELLKIICAGLFLIAFRCPAADDVAKTISRTFSVEPGGQISVDADMGDIDINTGNQNSVQVIIEREVSGDSDSKAASLLKAHKVSFSQDGKNVRVSANSPKISQSWFSHSDLSLHVHFRITVPQRFDAALNTAGGNIKVANLNGTVDARTSGGDLTFEKIQGAIDGHTSGGNIRANNCTEKLQIQTSGGNIVIKHFSGPNAQADTSGGNIDVSDCTGKLQAKTSGGNISIADFSGPSSYADTSGGSVTFDMANPIEGDSWLRTSGGNITVNVPVTAPLKVNAATDGGEVNCELPVTVEGKVHSGKLEGKINGGGPALMLKTSVGDIDIRIRKR